MYKVVQDCSKQKDYEEVKEMLKKEIENASIESHKQTYYDKLIKLVKESECDCKPPMVTYYGGLDSMKPFWTGKVPSSFCK